MNSSTKIFALTSEFEFLQLAKLYGKIAKSAENCHFNWNQKTALEEIKRAQNLVVQEDGMFVAFITYRDYGDRIEISALGSEPYFRNKGYSQMLLKELKICATKQMQPIWLEVHAENNVAMQLYQSCGFTAVQRRKGYYLDHGDAIVMTWTDGSNIQS